MREHRSEKSAPAPWRVPVAVEDIAETGARFDLAADDEVRAAIARLAGLRDLPRLQATFEITRQGGDGLRVSGRVSATVGQNCVVTLEPLVSDVEEDVEVVFMPQSAAAQNGDGKAGGLPVDAKWDDPEPLVGGVVDLGALATEFLILGINPYPRKAGATFEPPRDLQPEPGPFAALAGWTKGRNDG